MVTCIVHADVRLHPAAGSRLTRGPPHPVRWEAMVRTWGTTVRGRRRSPGRIVVQAADGQGSWGALTGRAAFVSVGMGSLRESIRLGAQEQTAQRAPTPSPEHTPRERGNMAMRAHRHRLEGAIFSQGRQVCGAIARATTLVRRLRHYVNLERIKVQYRLHPPRCGLLGSSSLVTMRASPPWNFWRGMRLGRSQNPWQPRMRGANDGKSRASEVRRHAPTPRQPERTGLGG